MLQGFNTINFGNDLKKMDKRFLSKFKIKMKSKNYLYKNCDVIILATNLNKYSYKLINKNSIKQFQKNPLIINIARGGVIDNMALVNALRLNKIRGACLDVYEKEPIEKNSSLKRFNNCILTSHNAFNTKNEVEFVHENTLKNIFKGLNLS